MKLMSNEKTGVNTVELEISVSAEQLEEAVKRVYTQKVKDISVPGFRKGKAPRKIVEKMYGEGVFLEDAVNELYPSVYAEAVEEAGIVPVDRAELEMLSIEKETGFTFKAIVTVKPEVSVTGYKGIKAEKTIYTVTDEQVLHDIGHMQERNARIVSVDDRAAIDGDQVVIDFDGYVDDVAFEGGKGESYQLTLGSHSFIDNFEDQIVGHSIGDEFDVNVSFPEEYHAEELKGKPALFKVKLCEIKQKELPELDDEFVKDVSEFDTVDELKDDVRKKLEETAKNRSQDELETKLVDAVLEGFEAEVPDVMYESRIDEMLREFEQRLQSQGMNLELYMQYTGMDIESFRKTFRDQAERQVKIRLALEKIAQLESIAVTDEELEAEYTKIAEAYSIDAAQVKQMIPAEEITKDASSNKAIDLIRDNAEVTEVAAPEDALDHKHEH